MDPEIIELLREGVTLLDEGRDPADVDRAIREETGGRFKGFDALADAAKAAGVTSDQVLAPIFAARRGIVSAEDIEAKRLASLESGADVAKRAAGSIVGAGLLAGGVAAGVPVAAGAGLRTAAPVAGRLALRLGKSLAKGRGRDLITGGLLTEVLRQ